jgi:hypothetical protein
MAMFRDLVAKMQADAAAADDPAHISRMLFGKTFSE